MKQKAERLPWKALWPIRKNGPSEDGERCIMMEKDSEILRRELLDEAYAGAFSGLGGMLLDAEEIRRADPEELEEIARRYGF